VDQAGPVDPRAGLLPVPRVQAGHRRERLLGVRLLEVLLPEAVLQVVRVDLPPRQPQSNSRPSRR
jgi:hypothetical protein